MWCPLPPCSPTHTPYLAKVSSPLQLFLNPLPPTMPSPGAPMISPCLVHDNMFLVTVIAWFLLHTFQGNLSSRKGDAGSTSFVGLQGPALPWCRCLISICPMNNSILCACVCAKLLQSCLTLCNPVDCSLPASSVHGDSPGKNTGVGCHPPQGHLSNPGIKPVSLISPALAAGSLPLMTLGKHYIILKIIWANQW